MAELKEGTWVVVADGEKALIMRNLTDHKDPNFELLEHVEQENPPNREQTTDKPGRMPDTGQGQRSALREADRHELARDKFAQELSDRLFQKAHSGAYRHLVLVAPPDILGELRSQLHKEVTDRLDAEIPKILTNHPIREIEKIVKGELDQV